MTKRIIGESPAGKTAFSLIDPAHRGNCCMSYELGDVSYRVRFKDYPTARTAAVRAIFSDELNFSSVQVSASEPRDIEFPFYESAGIWFEAQAFLDVRGLKTA
jgi:hypothetical protein